jgi:hypothetical protein
LYAGSFARPSLVVRLQQKGVNRVKLWTSFAAGDARQCLGVPEWFTLVERCATLGCRLARSAGGYGQPAGNQGAACNTLKRRDFWQPGGTGGLILSYEKKEGMGAGEVEKVESGGKSRPCCPCCQKPKEINGAGWHGRAACGRYRGGRASAWQGGADRHRHGHGQYGVALHIAGDFCAGIRGKMEIAETGAARGVPAKNVPPVCPREKCAPGMVPNWPLTH